MGSRRFLVGKLFLDRWLLFFDALLAIVVVLEPGPDDQALLKLEVEPSRVSLVFRRPPVLASLPSIDAVPLLDQAGRRAPLYADEVLVGQLLNALDVRVQLSDAADKIRKNRDTGWTRGDVGRCPAASSSVPRLRSPESALAAESTSRFSHSRPCRGCGAHWPTTTS